MAFAGDGAREQLEIAGRLVLSPDVGSEIRSLRERYGFTQEKLSRLLDLRRETLSRVESGHLPANVGTIQRLSAIVALAKFARDEAARAETRSGVTDAADLAFVAKSLRLPREVAEEVILVAVTSYDRKRRGLLKGVASGIPEG